MQNQDQIDYWNGDAGEKWSTSADTLDAMLRPFADAVLSTSAISGSEAVVDIGCGAGALSLAAARQTTGRVTGVDVSSQLLNTARQRAETIGASAEFIEADASNWTTPEPYDVLISRFGVMFFDDPIMAFTNLRKNMSGDGRLAFVCWQPLATNEWVTLSLQAAMPFFKEPPTPPPPGTPGPFAFGDDGYVRDILQQAGWSNVDADPFVTSISLPGATPEETAAFMLEIGPTARIISEQDLDGSAISDAIVDRLQTAPRVDGQVQLGASTWIVTANA